jgi:hypothetical protein
MVFVNSISVVSKCFWQVTSPCTDVEFNPLGIDSASWIIGIISSNNGRHRYDHHHTQANDGDHDVIHGTSFRGSASRSSGSRGPRGHCYAHD